VSGEDPYAQVEWEISTAQVGTFVQENVCFPKTWSADARNIVAQKYFRGTLGTLERETSLQQVIERVVTTIVKWSLADRGSLSDPQIEDVLADELRTLMLDQRMAFNSPVWFNLGVPGEVQQGSACFILSVDDDMDSILNWIHEEGRIFKHGSGAGVNLSKIRASSEHLKGGGTASGPVSFMRGADASAGTIKSGGKTRRAAKMVLLDVDHPDVEEFIWCKAKEERKIRALESAGFDMGLNGEDAHSVQYQNANNSVRLSDSFMEAATAAGDAPWTLTPRVNGDNTQVSAHDLLHQIAQAAWECADPGVQFSGTINGWHTLSAHSPINGSNPCSEYLSIDNSACNLASINLLKFLHTDSTFDIEGFRQAVRITITAMDAIAGNADYPTEAIGENTRKFRQLGLGYTNLGALLMAVGVAYDSDDGRAIAGAITSLMCGQAYLQSSVLAERTEPFSEWDKHKSATMGVLHRHTDAAKLEHQTQRARNGAAHPLIAPVFRAAVDDWESVVIEADRVGVRNAQACVLAPTGTISFFMDADTTGIEPEFALVKTKTLVGGGTIETVNRGMVQALTNLGYNHIERDTIYEYLSTRGELGGLIRDEHREIFATSVGADAIHYSAHVKMLAAVQPFLSGAASKTVNLPEDATVADFIDVITTAWETGVKCLALYRDNSKATQPLNIGIEKTTAVLAEPARKKLETQRRARTYSFHVGECKGYITAGEYDDGKLGELFIKVAKNGSTLAGIMDSFAISVSLGLQYGVPLAAYVDKFMHTRFEPMGMTNDSDVRISSSIVDYVFRRLALDYLSSDERETLGIVSTGEQIQQMVAQDIERPSAAQSLGVVCTECGSGILRRAGSCLSCERCGASTGCG